MNWYIEGDMNQKKSALVLSGGGALGLAHVGVLKAIEADYEFDFLAGVSAGSIVAAGIACGMNAKQIEHAINQTDLFSLAFDVSWKNTGLITGDAIKDSLDNIYGGRTFADLKVPLHIGATDFSTGQRVTISDGLIADAVRASLAIPVVFEPYHHAERDQYLVDGGLSQNFPLDLAIEHYQGEHIVGVNVANLKPLPEDFNTEKFFGRNQDLFKNVQRTFRIFFQNQQTHFPHDDRVRLIEPDLTEFSSATLSRRKFKQIMEVGQKSAENQ